MITVNGEKIQTKTTHLNELLSEMKLSNKLCAVEVNNVLVPYKERETYVVRDGDTVEVVSLVGGG